MAASRLAKANFASADREMRKRTTGGEYFDTNTGGQKMFSDEEQAILNETGSKAKRDPAEVQRDAQKRLQAAEAAYAKDPSSLNKRRRDNAKVVANAADENVKSRKAYSDKENAGKAQQDYGLAKTVTDDMYKVAPELLGDSARAGVTADQGAMAAQNKALDELFGIYSQGGATAQERARMARTRADQDQYLRSQREAQQQDLSERGMLGSGAEIAMALGDRQAAGSRMAQQDLETEAMLQDRALGALMQGSQVAGQIRGSSFNEGMARSTAKDEFAALNAGIINDAKASNADFLRQSKANLANQQYDSWQRGLDRNVGVATGIMGFDQDENQTGWSSAQQTAQNDANTANQAQRNDINDFKQVEGSTAGQNYGIQTQTNAETQAGFNQQAAGGKDIITGAGNTADAAMGGAAGGSSGSAMNFGSGGSGSSKPPLASWEDVDTANPYEDEED